MAYGPTLISSTKTEDASAPGAGSLSINPKSNKAGDVVFTAPTLDANGDELSGLTYAEVVVIEATAADAEQFREDFDGALAFTGAQHFIFDVTEGEVVTNEWKITRLGADYSAISRTADHARP